MTFQYDVKKRSPIIFFLHFRQTMPKRRVTLFLLMSLLLCSCAYQNNSLLLFPDSDAAKKQKKREEIASRADLFHGDIESLPMNLYDRKELNRIFEKRVSFQTILWKNNTDGHTYLIVLRPAYHPNRTRRVCRDAAIFPQTKEKTTDTFFITSCRKNNGQWRLINDKR